MNFTFNSIEEQLIFEGKLTQNHITEIRKIFSLLDNDKNGIISFPELALALQNFFQSPVSNEEAQMFFSKIDNNHNGVIDWNEFLIAIANWLLTFKENNDEISDDKNLSPTKRRGFHDKLYRFFLQFKKNCNFIPFPQESESEELLDLEKRSDYWSFDGQVSYLSSNDKWTILNDMLSQLIDIFKEISNNLVEKDDDNNLKGLQKVVYLLEVSTYFSTSFERFQISHFLIKLFDFLDTSIIIKVIKLLHESQNTEIILECLKIISIFSLGPRLSNLNPTSIYHTNQTLHKTFLLKNNILEILLKIIESPQNKAIKMQGLMALGFLCTYSVQIRDIIILQNGLNIIFKHYKPETDIEEMKRISWVLSILAGVTIKIPLKNSEEIESLIDLFIELLFWKDISENLINSLLGLSYLLPFFELKEKNQRLYLRITALLNHNNILVKRSAIFCIKNLISDDIHCQILIECQLIEKITNLLIYNSSELKVQIIELIKRIVEKGYTIWVMKDVELTKNLILLLYHPERFEIVKLFLSAINQNLVDVNRFFIQMGIFKAIIDNLIEFKQFDILIAEIYGYNDPNYDLNLFQNMCNVIGTLIRNLLDVEAYGVAENYAMILKEVQQINLEKLVFAFDTLLVDFNQNKIDYFILKNMSPNFGNVILNFLTQLLRLYSNFSLNSANTVFATNSIKIITLVLEKFQMNYNNLTQIIKFNPQNPILKGQQTELLISEIENPYNTKKLVINMNISLLELLLRIEHLFLISPINIYVCLEDSQRYLIDSDNTWQKIIQRNPLEIKLLISNPMSKGFRNYLPDEKTPQIFNYELNNNTFSNNMHSNLEKHDILLRELKEITKMSFDDIEILYKSFVNITRHRPYSQSDGSVNYEEFSQIMRNFSQENNFIKEIFNLLDFSKTGLADFRDFVRLIGILKSGNLEDKLRLYFKTYDTQNRGYLEKSDVFQMLQTSFSTSGYFFTNDEIQNKVAKIFESSDLYHDGKLTYTEFKQAVAKNYILISAFWLDPNQINLNIMNANSYFTNFNKDFGSPNNFNFNQNNNSLFGSPSPTLQRGQVIQRSIWDKYF